MKVKDRNGQVVQVRELHGHDSAVGHLTRGFVDFAPKQIYLLEYAPA
jgi:hypothetical protein